MWLNFPVSPKGYGMSPLEVPTAASRGGDPPSLTITLLKRVERLRWGLHAVIFHACRRCAMCSMTDRSPREPGGEFSPFGTTLEVKSDVAGIVSAAPSNQTRRSS